MGELSREIWNKVQDSPQNPMVYCFKAFKASSKLTLTAKYFQSFECEGFVSKAGRSLFLVLN